MPLFPKQIFNFSNLDKMQYFHHFWNNSELLSKNTDAQK